MPKKKKAAPPRRFKDDKAIADYARQLVAPMKKAAPPSLLDALKAALNTIKALDEEYDTRHSYAQGLAAIAAHKTRTKEVAAAVAALEATFEGDSNDAEHEAALSLVQILKGEA